MGIDRSNPLFAPSYRREWKHFGYTNIAHADAPEKWTHWEDLPAPYKYYHVKLDPADVEKTSFLYGIMNNWKTALPAIIAVGFPVFVFDVVFMDYHVELAGVTLTTAAIGMANLGPAIRKMLSADVTETKDALYKAEAEYFAAIDEAMDVYTKAQDAPQLAAHMNTGERALRKLEAAAASTNVKVTEVKRMQEMLEYLSTLQGASAAGQADTAAVLANRATEAKLESDSALQQATIADAIAALKAGGMPQPGNTTEKVFAAEFENVKKNPPKADPAVAAAQKQRDNEIFAKRFGFVDRSVTETMLNKAKSDSAAWAVLTAKTGGDPKVGAALSDPNPLQFRK